MVASTRNKKPEKRLEYAPKLSDSNKFHPFGDLSKVSTSVRTHKPSKIKGKSILIKKPIGINKIKATDYLKYHPTLSTSN